MTSPSPKNSTYRTKLTSSGVTVLIATGRLSFPDVDGLRQQLHTLVEGGAVRLVVDLSRVDSIDSSGIGALISGLKAARRAGGDLFLATPSAPVAGLLELMNLHDLLITADSLDQAFPHGA